MLSSTGHLSISFRYLVMNEMHFKWRELLKYGIPVTPGVRSRSCCFPIIIFPTASKWVNMSCVIKIQIYSHKFSLVFVILFPTLNVVLLPKNLLDCDLGGYTARSEELFKENSFHHWTEAGVKFYPHEQENEKLNNNIFSFEGEDQGQVLYLPHFPSPNSLHPCHNLDHLMITSNPLYPTPMDQFFQDLVYSGTSLFKAMIKMTSFRKTKHRQRQ